MVHWKMKEFLNINFSIRTSSKKNQINDLLEMRKEEKRKRR